MYTNCYDTAKVHVHSCKSTNDHQYCSWSSCVASLHWREELPLQHEGHNFHDDFAVAILQNSNAVGHVPRDIFPAESFVKTIVLPIVKLPNVRQRPDIDLINEPSRKRMRERCKINCQIPQALYGAFPRERSINLANCIAY